MRVFATLCALTAVAHAEPTTTPITDRDYRIDLYDGVPLGNSATIAMGGASEANAAGSSGTLVNASASAVRQTTDNDSWSWDYHLDYLNAGLSHDYTNSGLTTTTTGGYETFTLGGSVRVRDWAGAVTLSDQSAPLVGAMVTLPNGSTSDIDASTWRVKVAVAKWFARIDTAVGMDIQLAQLRISPDCSGPGCTELFGIQGAGLEAGATWIPSNQSFRLALSGSTPIEGGQVTASNCDPASCQGYILPDEVYVPWRVVAGGAYRFAGSAWNHQVKSTFRDERAVTVVADLVLTGDSPDSYGLEAFGLHELERSGRHLAWSPRAGAEYEWLPGRLRVRGGSYWEPARFDGVPGRVHGTFGIEVRVFEFHAWGLRRGRITLTGDLASGYDNLALSIGFWH
ncbi:MAG TPA: hypothetical protein VLX92_05755 [Kofleriaceae bacterium]|nr:hypothetical protein [Kofleriaceae bacterium]